VQTTKESPRKSLNLKLNISGPGNSWKMPWFWKTVEKVLENGNFAVCIEYYLHTCRR